MDDAQSVVDSLSAVSGGGGRHNSLLRTLGPALFISMGYIDLGKWVTTVDAGSRFGYDLVLLVLLFNFSAVLCQYLSICVGMVTGNNLAKICGQEYNQPTCVGLGLQALLSLLTAEITMISGIAIGFNLVFEYDDIVSGVWFASIAINLLPYAISHLDKRMAGTLNACIAGFALLCFVLGLLVSQPKVPLDMDVMFPKLSGESAYSLMALLGGNVIAHNFYVHSSFVQGQKRSSITLGALFHDHLVSIVFIFSGVFLVNYVLMSSAAVGSGNTLLLTFQDVVELMNQIFMNPAAPIVFLVVLLLSSHIISLSSIIGSHAVIKNFFGVDIPLSAHHLLLKIFAMIPTIYYAKVAGSEAIYQLLIICPVIQAMLLPASVIPVFRVSSSRSIMGSNRISSSVEILAFLAFLLMLFTNIIFVAEILFGDSTWTNSMKGNTGSPVVLPYSVIVLISCVSLAFTLLLAVTPLKSASNETETLELSAQSQREPFGTSFHGEEPPAFPEDAAHEEVQRSSIAADLRDPVEIHQETALEHAESFDATVEYDHDTQQSSAYVVATPKAQPSPSVYREEPKLGCGADWTEPMPKTTSSIEHITAENIKVKSTTEKDVEVVAEVCTDKDNDASRNLEYEKSAGCRAPFNPDGPPSLTFSRGKDFDAGNGPGSLSTLSGLGRAARRQLAAVLDEFWGHLFDYHGKLTQDANGKMYNVLLGLDLRAASSAVRADNQTIEASKTPLMRDAVRGSTNSLNSWDSMSRDQEIRSLDWNSGRQMGAIGSSNWSQSMNLPYTDISSSSSSLLDQNAKYYPNYNVPSYSDNQFYQPATIHGYQLASYLKGMNASKSPYSNIPLDPRRVPRSSESSFHNYADSAMHARSQNLRASLGANPLQSPTMNSSNAMERPYYDSATFDGNESIGSSAYSKKYHSSPDISAIIAASRKALLNEANLGTTTGNQSYLSKLASERSQYVDSAARSNAQIALNERSQHNLQRDALSMQLGINPNAKSLWAQQPFEQLFGVSSTELNKGDANTSHRLGGITKDDSSYTQYEAALLQSLRSCIMKLLKVEGSGWLFRQNGGFDENLIDQVAAAERISQETTENLLLADLQHIPSDRSMRGLPNCGENCVWKATLVVSFGVWCIHRVLDLSLVESRPELWGKYTYVLNRLQGIIEPAFSKPRKPLTGCTCLQIVGPVARPITCTFTTATVILEMIKDVEQAISGRKGRSGTAAGDVAFPKGKENLASVLKRYKRRLLSKPSAGQ